MRIAIDASRCTAPRPTGTEHYALELLRALIRQNTAHQLILYFRDAPAPDLLPAAPLVTQRVIPFPRLWTHLRLAAALWADRPDVTFVPAHTLPLAFPGRAVVTLHDVGFRHFPEAHPPRQRAYLDWTTRHSARRATLILTDSRATAADLTHFYGTPAAKLRVVYPGVTAPPPLAASPAGEQETAYFLFVGTLQPRKNIARLVAAYQAYRARVAQPAELVLAGGQGWLFDPAWVQDQAGVRWLGYVDETQKAALYRGALALVLPSLFEGFGFPVIEALLHGCPVIASETSSLPELVGTAGVLVNPLSVESITQALVRLAADANERATLRQRGFVQAQQFTWERAAADALAALEAAGQA